MSLVKLDTGFNIEVDFAIAPFHKRLFAWMIDLFVQWMIVKILGIVFDVDTLFIWVYSYDLKGVLLNLFPLFYHLLCEVFFNGRSIGKMVLNIKVITIEGGQPSLGQYLLRWSFRLVDFPIILLVLIISQEVPFWLFPLLFAGLVSVLAGKMSQRIGDVVAGTLIIDLRNTTSWQDTVFTEVESSYQPRYPQVMQLSDRDVNTLKSIIETVRRKGDYDLSLRIADRIKSKLKMDSDQDSLAFLETLLKDYNYYSSK